MIIIDEPANVQEIGSTGWLTDATGMETKLLYGQRGSEFFYAVDVAPQDDERDHQCWVGPYSSSGAMQDAAWATREPESDGQTATVNLPLPSSLRRAGVTP